MEMGVMDIGVMEMLGGAALSESAADRAAADRAAAELARLREQRWRLGRVRDDLESSGRRLSAQGVGALWRSPAQVAYENRLSELSDLLGAAWRALDDALAAVDVAIEQAKATR